MQLVGNEHGHDLSAYFISKPCQSFNASWQFSCHRGMPPNHKRGSRFLPGILVPIYLHDNELVDSYTDFYRIKSETYQESLREISV